MEQKVIRLTEEDLNKVIKESVEIILKENMQDEGFWDNMKGMFGKMSGDAKQGAKSAVNNISQKAQQGWQAGKDAAERFGNKVGNYAADVKAAGQMASNKADAQKAVQTITDLMNRGIVNQHTAKQMISQLNRYCGIKPQKQQAPQQHVPQEAQYERVPRVNGRNKTNAVSNAQKRPGMLNQTQG